MEIRYDSKCNMLVVSLGSGNNRLIMLSFLALLNFNFQTVGLMFTEAKKVCLTNCKMNWIHLFCQPVYSSIYRFLVAFILSKIVVPFLLTNQPTLDAVTMIMFNLRHHNKYICSTGLINDKHAYLRWRSMTKCY